MTTPTLREQLIEAAAKAIPFGVRMELLETWTQEGVEAVCRQIASDALDAILDVLEENSEEWYYLADEWALMPHERTQSERSSFIAVLREEDR